jgi:release factor glutamine methyltransferase
VRLVTLPGVFRPISDTWLLADTLESEALAPGARVLDICSGSGAIAVRAARRASVTAVDGLQPAVRSGAERLVPWSTWRPRSAARWAL